MEQIRDLQGLSAGDVAVATVSASAAASDLDLDVALRRAGTAGVSVLVLANPALTELPRTAEAIADRAEVTVLSADPPLDLAELCLLLWREIRGGADAELNRALDALNAMEDVAEDDGSSGEVAERIEAAMGTAVALGPPSAVQDNELSAEIVVDDDTTEVLSMPSGSPPANASRQLVLAVGARIAADLIRRRRHQAQIPAQTRSDLLTEILFSETAIGGNILDRARQVRLPVDSWHCVARIELENLETIARDPVDSYRLSQLVDQVAIEAAQASMSGIWNAARAGGSLVLVRSFSTEPSPTTPAAVVKAATQVIERIKERHPTLVVRCGVGTVHSGPNGLRASDAEARAAVATARASDRIDQPVAFDAVGITRALAEWFASDSARDSVGTLLKPLDSLGPQRSQQAIRTLRSYLDHHGSLQRVAKELNLHRNTVHYRVTRALDVLDLDIEEPDQRLMLHLACRARALGT